MDLSTEQLEEITKLSGLLIRPHDIAIFLQVDENEFLYEIQNKSSEIFKAFRIGVLKIKIANRKNLIIAAEDSYEANIEIKNLLEEYESLIQTDINDQNFEKWEEEN